MKGTWCETAPSDRRERRRWRGTAVIGRDKVVGEWVVKVLMVEEIKSLIRGLWRVSREV